MASLRSHLPLQIGSEKTHVKKISMGSSFQKYFNFLHVFKVKSKNHKAYSEKFSFYPYVDSFLPDLCCFLFIWFWFWSIFPIWDSVWFVCGNSNLTMFTLQSGQKHCATEPAFKRTLFSRVINCSQEEGREIQQGPLASFYCRHF